MTGSKVDKSGIVVEDTDSIRGEKDLPKTYDSFITVEMPDESAVGIKTKQIETISEEYIGKLKDAHTCLRAEYRSERGITSGAIQKWYPERFRGAHEPPYCRDCQQREKQGHAYCKALYPDYHASKISPEQQGDSFKSGSPKMPEYHAGDLWTAPNPG